MNINVYMYVCYLFISNSQISCAHEITAMAADGNNVNNGFKQFVTAVDSYAAMNLS